MSDDALRISLFRLIGAIEMHEAEKAHGRTANMEWADRRLYELAKEEAAKYSNPQDQGDMESLPRRSEPTYKSSITTHNEGQGESLAAVLREFVANVKNVQDGLALAWSQTDPQRSASNLREMVRKDEAALGKLADDALSALEAVTCKGQDLDPSCPTCGALPGETQFESAERAELLSVLFQPKEVREAVADRLLKRGQGECDGSGQIPTGECAVAMSGPTCMNPDCPPCQTPETDRCPGCSRCESTDSPSQPDAPSVTDQSRAEKKARESVQAGFEPQDQETPKLNELRLWVEAAEEGTSNSREAKAFRRVVERIRSLRSFEPQDQEGLQKALRNLEPPDYAEKDFGKGTSLLAAYRAGYFDAKQDACSALQDSGGGE